MIQWAGQEKPFKKAVHRRLSFPAHSGWENEEYKKEKCDRKWRENVGCALRTYIGTVWLVTRNFLIFDGGEITMGNANTTAPGKKTFPTYI